MGFLAKHNIISRAQEVGRYIFHPHPLPTVKEQTTRQVVSGATTTLLDLVAFQGLVWMGLNPYFAAILTFCVAMLINFSLTRWYVFVNFSRQGLVLDFLFYFFSCLGSLVIAQVCLWLFFGVAKLPALAAKVLAVPFIFIWTVISSRCIFLGTLSDWRHSMRERERERERERVNKWPKILPELTLEQQSIRADFMRRHLEAMQTKWYGTLIERFNHRYPLRTFTEGCRTLELGAGVGAHLAYEHLATQKYYANEYYPQLCAKIENNFPGVTTIPGDCQCRLPFEDGYFDRILAIHVLEHLPNLPATLQEMHRLLRTDGKFSVVIPCEGGLAYTLARNISARPHFEKMYGQPYTWFIKAEHINYPQEIKEELNRFFVVVHQTYFPLALPWTECNLAIGITLRKKY